MSASRGSAEAGERCAAAMEPVEFAAPGVRIRGERWQAPNSNRGDVLMLHGAGQRRLSWRRTSRRLAGQGWTVYAVDARGHGDSDWSPSGAYAQDDFIEDVCAIGDAIGNDLVVVGASMGGMTALLAEGERGGLAQALVLVDVVARLEPAGVSRIQQFLRQSPDGFADLREVYDAISAYNPHRKRPFDADGLKKTVRRRADGRWHWHWDPAFMDGIGGVPAREVSFERARLAASAISIPTLVIRGRRSDIVSQAGLDETVRLIPGAAAVDIDGAGHMVAGDDNDAFTAGLEAFLAGHGTRVAR